MRAVYSLSLGKAAESTRMRRCVTVLAQTGIMNGQDKYSKSVVEKTRQAKQCARTRSTRSRVRLVLLCEWENCEL